MIDGRKISDELLQMRDERADSVIQRVVQRMHETGQKYNWVGVYLLSGDQLVLHSYIGKPTEHTRIKVGQGVCGTAVAEGRDINVPDVEALDNYLACSVETKSEIVMLIRDGDRILGQIDIDSDTAAAFTEDDERELRTIADTLGELLGPRLSHDQ